MRRLLDTSVLVNLLEGDRATLMLLAGFVDGDDELWALSTARAEILQQTEPDEESEIRQLFAALRWADVTPDVADRAGSLARTASGLRGGRPLLELLPVAAAHVLNADFVRRRIAERQPPP